MYAATTYSRNTFVSKVNCYNMKVWGSVTAGGMAFCLHHGKSSHRGLSAQGVAG